MYSFHVLENGGREEIAMVGIRRGFILVLALCLCCSLVVNSQSHAQSMQSTGQSQTQSSERAVRVRSNLVLVPTLVKTKAGEVVLTLTADDFIVKDDGIPQVVEMEQDTDSQPLALAVIVQTGGEGTFHLSDYRDLGAVLDAIIGGVQHHVAVISFDSKPHIEQEFTSETDKAAAKMGTLTAGDNGAAILDALNFGIGLLQQQPAEFRRAVLLCSETIDGASKTNLREAVRAVDDTNTAIYSFAFSSTKTAIKHEESKVPLPQGTPYGETPYAPGGCMSRDPNADPDAHGNRAVQAFDCASDLLPPLRLARMAFIAAKDGLKQNVPESVARLTGGEYFGFENAKTLKQNLIAISSDVPNYYVLSIRPLAPHQGFHTLEVSLKDKQDMRLKARRAYWADEWNAAGADQ